MPPVVEPHVQRPSTIHVLLEFGCEQYSAIYSHEVSQNLTDCSLGFGNLRKLNNTAAFRACALEQDLRQFNLTGGLEQFHQILVRSRPRELIEVVNTAMKRWVTSTYVANHDLLARFGIEATTEPSAIATSVARHTPTGRSLVWTRVVGVEIVGEVAACTWTAAVPAA